MIIKLVGRIDSNNASTIEADILNQIGESKEEIIFDAADLDYISSAGLRVLLRVKKANPNVKVINVNSTVYEILDMTGFTEILDVAKEYRLVSVEGCEEIGRGANGIIYRIDQDNVVKVYKNADALEDIQHEREVAKLALILGIPTAISYDVVKVGNSYGSVFELLNASSFSSILVKGPKEMDWCVEESVRLLKKIHETEVPENKLPDIKKVATSWVEFVKDYLPKDKSEKLVKLINDVPYDNHMIHGDYHSKNIVLQNDEVLIIDMDTLAVGHPIFEFASMYNAYIGYAELNHDNLIDFLGFPFETGVEFFHKSLATYLNTNSKAKIKEVEDKARIIGYVRMMRRLIRRGGLNNEEDAKAINFFKQELLELLEQYDTLLFSENELNIPAINTNLDDVQEFVQERLDRIDCPLKAVTQIALAVEEIFVNIANYAYSPEIGTASIRVEVSNNPVSVKIVFLDHGVPYDPLSNKDPDITLSAEERSIGGLGIFMTKKIMDDVTYEYKDGQNILTLKKNL